MAARCLAWRIGCRSSCNRADRPRHVRAHRPLRGFRSLPCECRLCGVRPRPHRTRPLGHRPDGLGAHAPRLREGRPHRGRSRDAKNGERPLLAQDALLHLRAFHGKLCHAGVSVPPCGRPFGRRDLRHRQRARREVEDGTRSCLPSRRQAGGTHAQQAAPQPCGRGLFEGRQRRAHASRLAFHRSRSRRCLHCR